MTPCDILRTTSLWSSRYLHANGDGGRGKRSLTHRSGAMPGGQCGLPLVDGHQMGSTYKAVVCVLGRSGCSFVEVGIVGVVVHMTHA